MLANNNWKKHVRWWWPKEGKSISSPLSTLQVHNRLKERDKKRNRQSIRSTQEDDDDNAQIDWVNKLGENKWNTSSNKTQAKATTQKSTDVSEVVERVYCAWPNSKYKCSINHSKCLRQQLLIRQRSTLTVVMVVAVARRSRWKSAKLITAPFSVNVRVSEWMKELCVC